MNVIQFPSSTHIRRLSSTETQIATRVYESCFNLRKGEQVLIVTDANKYNTEAAVFFEGAKRYTDAVTLWQVDGMQRNGEEPPISLVRAMQEAKVVLLITTYSISHTHARLTACARGARIASLPGITIDMLERAVNVEYQNMATLSIRLADILSDGTTVRITSSAGTDVTLVLKGRLGIADTGDLTQDGAFGNLPAGEAFIAPREGTAKGIIVFDGAFANIELDTSIKVHVNKGKIIAIQGQKAAQTLRKQLKTLSPRASFVCEFGLGTNPKAQISPHILEAEKVFGTCHIAFGRNCMFGGIIDVPYHADGLIKEPTVMIDGKKILAGGKILV